MYAIIIIIIMSLFYEDNIFSTSTNLTYGPRWKTYHTEQYHTIYTLCTVEPAESATCIRAPPA